jgi:serine/threonine protein kinase
MIPAEGSDPKRAGTTSFGDQTEQRASTSGAEGSTIQAPPLPSSTEDIESQGPRRIGKYRVVERLGRGGQAEVFRAIHPDLPGQDVVIKWARQDAPEPLKHKLLEEGRILSRVRVPGLIRVYDADLHEGRPFLVLEYLPGVTLRDLLRQGPFHPPKRHCWSPSLPRLWRRCIGTESCIWT